MCKKYYKKLKNIFCKKGIGKMIIEKTFIIT